MTLQYGADDVVYANNLGAMQHETFAPYDLGPMMGLGALPQGLSIPKLLFSPLRALGETETQMETLAYFGEDPAAPVSGPILTPTTTMLIIGAFIVTGALVGGYHGYKKYGDIGSTLAWGAAGGSFPVPTALVALATGYAKR